jgi:hypothetical protein
MRSSFSVLRACDIGLIGGLEYAQCMRELVNFATVSQQEVGKSSFSGISLFCTSRSSEGFKREYIRNSRNLILEIPYMRYINIFLFVKFY